MGEKKRIMLNKYHAPAAKIMKNHDFSIISSSKFRKIEISRGSEGVRSSALDMFYPKDITFDVLRKKPFSKKNSLKKNQRKKNLEKKNC